jgi:hypothetical protein
LIYPLSTLVLIDNDELGASPDDPDKQDPADVFRLLRRDQAMLKGQASFVLTGYPSVMATDLSISELGLFDLVRRADGRPS